MKVIISGTRGVVGQSLVENLDRRSCEIFKLLNENNGMNRECSSYMEYSSLREIRFTGDGLNGYDCVIHLAARVHDMSESSGSSPLIYREVNTDGTLNLAKEAARVGVRKFIFISTVKVNGEATVENGRFFHTDKHQPEDFYGQSKSEAELGLWEIAKETGMEVVVIRPPLVYGPGVKGNFAKLIEKAQKGSMLPLGAVNNLRSLVAIENLVDLIVTCIDHPKAANQTFLVSDDEDVSTTVLLQRLYRAFGHSPNLLPIPEWAFRLPASLIGKKDVIDRLFGNLQVDISHTKETLGWTPPVTMEEQMAKIAASYKG